MKVHLMGSLTIFIFFWLQDLAEAKRRLEEAEEDRKKTVPDIRKESRQKYLKMRREDKLKELEADIHDDEYLFAQER